MDIKKFIAGLFKAIYILLILFVIYQIIRALVGGTWSTENIMIAGMGVILAGLFAIAGFLINQGICMGRLEERTENIGNSLSKLGSDFKAHTLTKHKS